MWKYSNKNKLLFWHVPRTGGSYVEFVLSNYYDFNDNIFEVPKQTKINASENPLKMQNFLNNLHFEINKLTDDELLNLAKNQLQIDFNNKLVTQDLQYIECYNYIYEEKEIMVKNKKIKIYLYEKDSFNHNKKLYALNQYITYHFLIKNNDLFFEKNWNKIKKFCIVRNPYDRAISSFEFIKQRINEPRISKLLQNSDSMNNLTFFDLFNNPSKYLDHIYMSHHVFSTQNEYITDEKFNTKFNFILKYENLENDLIELLNNLGIPDIKHLELIKNNVKIFNTKRNKFEFYYSNKENILLINKLFKDDFINFNYPIFETLKDIETYFNIIENNKLKYLKYLINSNDKETFSIDDSILMNLKLIKNSVQFK